MTPHSTGKSPFENASMTTLTDKPATYANCALAINDASVNRVELGSLSPRFDDLHDDHRWP
ncbi:hypothetical protein FHX52_3873 [Humibacillus xanthopallidus]|uniref:Uncharacterized protein n=1 Tax=Humibacillus xanthopallidus TaxID=412689 RepID=A0A543PKP6_9MICO|nr:hypothetical protein FHX52_3873 [Humibacillus xanthopallidus]